MPQPYPQSSRSRPMVPLSGLRTRVMEPEWMDQPDIDAAAHERALVGLGRINWISRVVGVLWPVVRRRVRARLDRGERTPLRLLDLACGGGDVALGLAQRALRERLPLVVAGCDRSPQALDHARAHALARGLDVTFMTQDLLGAPLPDGHDILTCCLFLHHLDEAAAVHLMRAMNAAAGELALIDDLSRCRLGYAAAWLGVHSLTFSPVVRLDGLRSVRAAFTVAEALEIAAQAGWDAAHVRRHWPWRFVLGNRPL